MGTDHEHIAQPNRQRLDKWLWFARMVKSRTLAQKLIASGAVRVNSKRTTSADYRLEAGMVLTMTLNQRLRIVRITNIGTRRGPASEAQMLYDDLTPELPKSSAVDRIASPAQRPPGAGRPTKKERRDTTLFRVPPNEKP